MIREIAARLSRPGAAAASAVSAVLGIGGGLLQIPFLHAVWITVWSSLGTLFAGLSIIAWQLAPRMSLPWIPTDAIGAAAMVVGALYVFKLVAQTFDKLTDRLNS